MGSLVEVLLLSARDGCLRYRRVSRPLSGQVHPDDLARLLSGLTGCVPGGVLHSTSWRYETGAAEPGVVVLTYAALPDPDPDGPHELARPVKVDAMASGGPLTPSPVVVDIDAVAAHACRHLALLATVDEAVAGATRLQPGLWELISKLTPASAGALAPAYA